MNLETIFENFKGTIQNLTITQQLTIASISLASIFVLWKLRNIYQKENSLIKYPPGPSGIPLIGSIHLAKIIGIPDVIKF